MPYLSRMLRKHAAPIHVSIRNPAFVRAPGFFFRVAKTKETILYLDEKCNKKTISCVFFVKSFNFRYLRNDVGGGG